MNNNIYDKLGLILQSISLQILFKDFNNTDLMHELKKQDKEYFEKIIIQNEEILNLLKKEENNDGRKINKKNE